MILLPFRLPELEVQIPTNDWGIEEGTMSLLCFVNLGSMLD
jgi:hypothetical protein